MKAIRIHESGGADVLRLEEVEKPKLTVGSVLIKGKSRALTTLTRCCV